MGKLDGKVAVITGATSGMALAGAKLFVEEGAHVFITGRRQDALDEAVELIGNNVTGVQGDSADLDDIDRLFETVKQEKGTVDVLWTSAGAGGPGRLGEITEEQFDTAFSVNARGTLFTVQKALPLLNDGGSIFMTGSNASLQGLTRAGACMRGARPCRQAWARVWLAELKDRRIRVNVLTPGQVATVKHGGTVLTEATKAAVRVPDPAGRRWAVPRRSRPSHCSSPRTTPATSTAWNWSPTEAPQSSDLVDGDRQAAPRRAGRQPCYSGRRHPPGRRGSQRRRLRHHPGRRRSVRNAKPGSRVPSRKSHARQHVASRKARPGLLSSVLFVSQTATRPPSTGSTAP